MQGVVAILAAVLAIYLYYLFIRWLFVSVGPAFVYVISIVLSLAVPIVYLTMLLRTFARPGGASNPRNWLFAVVGGLVGLIYVDLLFLGIHFGRGILPVSFGLDLENLLEGVVRGWIVNGQSVMLVRRLQPEDASIIQVVLSSAAIKCAVLVPAVLTIRGLASQIEDSRQPARLSYFYRQAIIDLKAVMWPMVHELAAAVFFAAKGVFRLSAGPHALAIWPLTIMAYLALALPVIIAAVATLLFILMHSVVLAAIWLFAMGISFLLYACERAVIVSRAGYAKCPHAACHAPVPLPVFLCPACGIRHDSLLPGRCGVLFRTCKCSEAKLPTLFWLGKGKLRSLCPHCGKPMREELFAENVHIPIYGGPGTGKTMFMMAATWQLMEKQVAGLKARLIEEAADDAYHKHWKPDFEFGRVREKTARPFPNAFLLGLRRDKGLPTSIYLYDPAGEALLNEGDLEAHRFMNYFDGLAILIDPLSIRSFAARYRERGGADLSPTTSSADPEDTVARVVNLLQRLRKLSHRRASTQRIAVIFSKADISGFAEEVGIILNKPAELDKDWDRAGLEDSSKIRAWLDESEGHLLRMLETKFKNLRFFAVSALGHYPQTGQAFTPRRVMDPMVWLLSTHRTLARPTMGVILGRAMEVGAVAAAIIMFALPLWGLIWAVSH
jgi:hypothetical protein